MNKIGIGYLIVSNSDIKEFMSGCDQALDAGFQLHGGVSTVVWPGNPPSIVYSQAFVKQLTNAEMAIENARAVVARMAEK